MLSLCLYDVNFMSVKPTTGYVRTLRQGPGILVLLSLRHEADVDENSHRFVAGYISKFENNEVIDDNQMNCYPPSVCSREGHGVGAYFTA
jgi:hypothetical protein